MARARNIKPGFFTNDDLGELSPLARLGFIGLWGQADFNGNMKYKPKRLRVEVLPYDNVDFAELVGELQQAGFVEIYQVDGENYLHVVNFRKHQRPHKNEVLRGTDIPQPVTGDDPNGTDPERNGIETEQERDENRSNPPDTGYRIPDSGSPQPDADKNTGSAEADPACESASPKKFTDDDFENFWTACRDNWFGRTGTKKEARTAFFKLKPSQIDLAEITRLTVLECQSRKRQQKSEGFSPAMKHVCRWIRYEGWQEVNAKPRVASADPLNAPTYSQDQWDELDKIMKECV